MTRLVTMNFCSNNLASKAYTYKFTALYGHNFKDARQICN